jgi:hypothetical protein
VHAVYDEIQDFFDVIDQEINSWSDEQELQNDKELQDAINLLHDNEITKYDNITDFRSNDNLRRDEA